MYAANEHWVPIEESQLAHCRYCGEEGLAWVRSKNDKPYLVRARYNDETGEYEADRRGFHSLDCTGKRSSSSSYRQYDRQEKTNGNQDHPGFKRPASVPVQEDMKSMLEWGYRKMALMHHPDHGGSNERMQQVNEAIERLRKLMVG